MQHPKTMEMVKCRLICEIRKKAKMTQKLPVKFREYAIDLIKICENRKKVKND